MSNEENKTEEQAAPAQAEEKKEEGACTEGAKEEGACTADKGAA